MFSAGGGSWRTANLVRQMMAPGDTHQLVFTDVLYEDADAYRFLVEGAAQVFGRSLSFKVPRADDFPDYRVAADVPLADYAGNPEWRAFLRDLRAAALSEIPELVWLVEGRDPWEVFRDKRFLGNSRVDPCSRMGKREPLDTWRLKNCDPADSAFYVGIGEEEKHRFERLQPRMAEDGWDYRSPLIGRTDSHLNPVLFIRAAGLEPPRLYLLGYVHNNCGGFCIKAGHAHYANRYRVQPERFAYDAMMEEKLRLFLGRDDIAMMTDRSGGEKRPLTLTEFGARMATAPQTDFFYDNDSGCGCMLEV
jgi:hypothetical protein